VPGINRGLAFFMCGEQAAAQRCFEVSLRSSLRHSLQTELAYSFLGLAATAASKGDTVSAARLAGAADGVADQAGLRFNTFESEVKARTLASARKQLGSRFDHCYIAGREADPTNLAESILADTQPV
jgi:hypothetical protein